MECPRCGATVTEYALGGQTTLGCAVCGWLGVEVEHRREPTAEESWAEARRRFRSRAPDEESDEAREETERV